VLDNFQFANFVANVVAK